MPFQFLCPQGHVLQADESQVGLQCMCPYCGQQFLVPAPVTGQRGVQTHAPGSGGSAVVGPSSVGPSSTHQVAGAGVVGVGASTGATGQQTAAAGFALFPGAQHSVLHIVCPSGHVLETPREMIGEDALCPFCQVQFRLRYENSIEYRKQRQAERERRELERGRMWMQWSFAIAAVVVLGVILLIAASVSR